MDIHEALEVLISSSSMPLKRETSEEVCEDNPCSSQSELSEGTSSLQPPLPVSSSSEIISQQVSGKKRTRNPEKWKKTIRQRLRNNGGAYFSVKGKAMAKKEFQNTPCLCKKRCNTKFSEKERRRIFESFWKLGDYSKQNIYIWGCVQPCSVRRKRPREGCGSHADTSQFEWCVNQHRDTYGSFMGHFDLLNLVAVAENETKARIRFNLMEKMVQPCGPPPEKNEEILQ
ncbi:Splicing factor 3B subunit 5 [Armadillidium nasatum]|uniref:Splicing factor 3B subunit 5 n=1 Tax=Armadillidium nasatum TaxID=96803 RepID=A0A5N5T364_9CRUS|nr:Splicing factor 3B subunit 5 [Armadillidium nasatum]